MKTIKEMPLGLSPNDQTAWGESNLSINDKAHWYLAQRQRVLIQTGKIKANKAHKAGILKQQGSRCALCLEDIEACQRVCLDKPHSTIICLLCNLYLTARRTARAKGITEELTERYEQSL